MKISELKMEDFSKVSSSFGANHIGAIFAGGGLLNLILSVIATFIIFANAEEMSVYDKETTAMAYWWLFMLCVSIIQFLMGIIFGGKFTRYKFMKFQSIVAAIFVFLSPLVLHGFYQILLYDNLIHSVWHLSSLESMQMFRLLGLFVIVLGVVIAVYSVIYGFIRAKHGHLRESGKGTFNAKPYVWKLSLILTFIVLIFPLLLRILGFLVVIFASNSFYEFTVVLFAHYHYYMGLAFLLLYQIPLSMVLRDYVLVVYTRFKFPAMYDYEKAILKRLSKSK
ncbi:hypothetical protein SM124_17895 [Bacillus sp. 31A1R]|uniref:Uncharacterized protein n=1 Tax=Robertmurraya mangrovi TaxID=3098077 RepID=A0ABU5J2E2_9BACI|nr:hypothetical protein [Bacillus sp. 31A1R]MDZ5473592.1 hypothetical protein [Bacillus sp. 31A1R]